MTDIKIAKTSVSRIAVTADVAADMVTTLLIALASIIWRNFDDTAAGVFRQPLFMLQLSIARP
jgi:hypothetical protein